MSPRILTLAALVALAGCDPRVFDDVADSTWVVSSGRPESMDSGDYGIAVVATAVPGGSGVNYTVAGSRQPGLANIGFDAAGKQSAQASLIGEISSDTAFTSLTLAGSDVQIGSTGVVFVGLPDVNNDAGYVVAYGATGKPGGLAVLSGPTSATRVGEGLATGITDVCRGGGAEDQPIVCAGADVDVDVLATGDDQVSVLVDVKSRLEDNKPYIARVCQVSRQAAFAVLAADVEASSGQEVVVAMGETGGASGTARLEVFRASDLAAADPVPTDTTIADCPTPLDSEAAPAGVGDFGKALARGDFDDNGQVDLVAAAPSRNSVFVLMNYQADGTADNATMITVEGPAGSSTFGELVAVGELDGQPGDELVIADSHATVDGAANAGRVVIMTLSGGSFSSVQTLHDVSPDSSQRFGRGLTVASFGGSDDILVVAAIDEVFTYFRTSTVDDDPRQ